MGIWGWHKVLSSEEQKTVYTLKIYHTKKSNFSKTVFI